MVGQPALHLIMVGQEEELQEIDQPDLPLLRWEDNQRHYWPGGGAVGKLGCRGSIRGMTSLGQGLQEVGWTAPPIIGVREMTTGGAVRERDCKRLVTKPHPLLG